MNSPELPLEIDVHAVQTLLQGSTACLLLDCREPEEHATVHIPKARLIPMNAIPARLAELEPHKQQAIVVHCHHGGRSLRVAAWLRKQGFATAQSMAGGIDAWSLQIDPSLPRY